jgi:GntR family transcriptional regulator
MIDLQRESPVPIHEQIISQLMEHVALGTLRAGAQLAEYRAFAQELLTNPQVVAKAYGELEGDGVLKRQPSGAMEVTAGADRVCRVRLQDAARARIAQVVAQGMAWGLPGEEIRRAVEEQLAAPPPLSAAEASSALKKPHASSHRDSQGIQDLSWKKGAGPPDPERAEGGHFRPLGG